jgi:hypothetical protein
MWLRFLVPLVLISIGSVQAGDLPDSNAAESPPVVEPQYFPVDSSFDTKSPWTASARDLAPPNATQSPPITPVAQPQYFAAAPYFDADSLGVRSLGADINIAPFGISKSGVRFRASGNASWYRFVTSEDPRTFGTGRYVEGSLLAGYGIWVPRFNIVGLVGPTFGEGVNQGVITTDRWGVKAVLEIYAKPTDQTMASGSASYSTIGNKLEVQVKAGLKIFGNVYFGPEAKFAWQQILPWQTNISTAAVTFTSVQPQTQIATMRVGAHISALSLGPVLMGVSGGWAHDQQLRNGYYGSAWLYQPF